MRSEASAASRNLLDAFGNFRKLHRHYSPVEGMRPSEFYALIAVKRTQDQGEPGMRVSDLARRLDVATPTATQFVKRLESAGYVERTHAGQDKRAVHVALTKNGRTVLDDSFAKLCTSFDGLVAHLGEGDSVLLADLLNKTAQYFKETHHA